MVPTADVVSRERYPVKARLHICISWGLGRRKPSSGRATKPARKGCCHDTNGGNGVGCTYIKMVTKDQAKKKKKKKNKKKKLQKKNKVKEKKKKKEKNKKKKNNKKKKKKKEDKQKNKH